MKAPALILSLSALVALGACAPAPEALSFTLLDANVGSADPACEGYEGKLCLTAVEEHLAARIASLAPDIVVLQEVVGRHQCGVVDDDTPGFVCHRERTTVEPSQARRLVGEGYDISCTARHGFECVAVKRSFGSLAGCTAEGACDAAETAPVVEGCDPSFSVSGVNVELRSGGRLRVVNAHADEADEGCRAAQVRQVFALAGPDPTLVAGSLQLDPFANDDESVRAFLEHVGDNELFGYHSGPAEHEPPYPTKADGGGTLDHVLSDFAEGACVTLGAAPRSEPLAPDDGTDHRALWCALEM